MTEERLPLTLRERVLHAARTASNAGLFVANQGNFSARDRGTGLITMTPHDLPYEGMTVDDLVIVDLAGQKVEGALEPSFDVSVHATVYRHRPDVGAVIHTEPHYVNAFGAIGMAIEPVTTTGLKSANGIVPIMPFRTVRDETFAEEMLEVMADHHAVVWGNHGMLVIGATIEQALDRSLGVEFNAKVFALSRLLGEPNKLTYLDAAMVKA